MKEGEELWRKYCSFFDKPFSEQVEYNNNQMQKYFEKWKKTKMAKKLCPKGAKKLEDVPLTTYDDYPILHDFGARIERLSETVPRRKGESLWNYYDRISRKAVPMLDGWMVDEYAFCAKTSGTTGESKWFAHGKEFWENCRNSIMAATVIACTDERGTTKIKKGDKVLNVGPPVPYISGYIVVHSLGFLKPIPPLEVTDNILNFRKKVMLGLKAIEKGTRIDYFGGLPAGIHLTYEYLSDKESFFKEYYQSMNFGFLKLIMFIIWLKCKIRGKKCKKISELMPLKGIAGGGVDLKLYLDFFKDELGVEYLNDYGSTELGFGAHGRPDRKSDLVFDLRTGFYEFLNEKGEIKKIDELSKGNVYEVVGTPFGSTLIRYRIGDLLKLIDFQDGNPIFDFAGRTVDILNVYGWFRMTHDIALNALKRAGLSSTDKWAIIKDVKPKEKIRVLMENTWQYSEREAEKRIFNALVETYSDFNDYIKGFKIKDPSEVVKVEYLRKGAFLRYTMKKSKDGSAMGQIKPPKIIPPEKIEVADMLRGV
ncbi:MAG: GH3 auxin-responsive promoter family protein [Hadesarchaea archaeon]|nr:GH3 auxin-responsive promoter family protein [Hadesarchaea archaeon]MDH5685347.1 GH3 auxin-responsive promoter family protein [Hadesarchaea archaeon]